MLINPVLVVLVPFEVQGLRRVKRDDLPRFVTADEVREFLTRNPGVSTSRAGVPIRLEWIEHHESWAIAEYHHEVGKWRH